MRRNGRSTALIVAPKARRSQIGLRQRPTVLDRDEMLAGRSRRLESLPFHWERHLASTPVAFATLSMKHLDEKPPAPFRRFQAAKARQSS
jgi:hypothetical protein